MEPLILDLPAQIGLTALRHWLQQGESLNSSPAETVQRHYLDSFDWRLYRAGYVLEAQQRPHQSFKLLLRCLGSGQVIAMQNTTHLPQLAEDLPPFGLGRVVIPLLEMRALLPQLSISQQIEPLWLENSSGKTLLRLELQHPTQMTTSDSQQPHGYCQLLPVRGYEKALQQTLSRLTRKGRLQIAASDPLERELRQRSRQPDDYSSKLQVKLSPPQRSNHALQKLLRSIFSQLQRNLPGVRDDIDSEFLHDLRVAGRRSRSLLSYAKQIFPTKQRDHFLAEFAWLNQVSGPARDLDVYLLEFPHYQASLPEPLRSDLQPLKSFLQQGRQRAYQPLLRAINSRRFSQLEQQWSAFLRQPSEEKRATEPVKQLADRQLRKAFDKLLTQGKAINKKSPPESWHTLRKTAKKLRYLLESFQSLYPKAVIRRFIKALKQLQDPLGIYQDLHIQQQSLKQFEQEMARAGQLSKRSRKAIDALVEILAERERQTRSKCEQHFESFSHDKSQTAFKAMLTSSKGGKA